MKDRMTLEKLYYTTTNNEVEVKMKKLKKRLVKALNSKPNSRIIDPILHASYIACEKPNHELRLPCNECESCQNF